MSLKNHFCATCADKNEGYVHWMTQGEAEQHQWANLDHNVQEVK